MIKKIGAFLAALFRALGCLALGLCLYLALLACGAFAQGETLDIGKILSDLLSGFLSGGLLPGLALSAPVMLLGLSAALAWQTGQYQLGGAGLYALGAAAAMAGAGRFAWYICLLLGAVAGCLCGGFIGWLKARFRVHEALSTALLNWLCLYGVQAAVSDWRPSAMQRPLWGAVILTGLVTLGLWAALRFTAVGFSARTLGVSEAVARYAGVQTGKTALLALVLSGAVGGISGALAYCLGNVQAVPTLDLALNGPGLYGLAGAVLARGSLPVAVCVSLILSRLAQGAETAAAPYFLPEAAHTAFAAALYLGALISLPIRHGKGGGRE